MGGSSPTYAIPTPEAPWNLCADTDLHEEATVVTAHEQADHFWLGWEDRENQRIVDAAAELRWVKKMAKGCSPAGCTRRTPKVCCVTT